MFRGDDPRLHAHLARVGGRKLSRRTALKSAVAGGIATGAAGGLSGVAPVPASVRSGWSSSSMWCSSGTDAVPIRRPPLSRERSRGRKASVAATPSACVRLRRLLVTCRGRRATEGVALTDSCGRVAVR